MARMLATLVVLAVLAYAVLCAALFAWQRSLIYYPQPRSLGAHESAETFEVDGVALQLTVRPHAGPGAVLYFGGNGEDVSASLPGLVAAYPARELVLLHYRGYSGSGGRPSEAALAGDARALFDRVHARHPDVIVIGRSLGSGVAVRLATEKAVAGLILDAPFTSAADVAGHHYWYLPVWLLRDQYRSIDRIHELKVPLLVIHGDRDGVIPIALGRRLFAAAPEPKRFVTLPGVDHVSVLEAGGLGPVRAFLDAIERTAS